MQATARLYNTLMVNFNTLSIWKKHNSSLNKQGYTNKSILKSVSYFEMFRRRYAWASARHHSSKKKMLFILAKHFNIFFVFVCECSFQNETFYKNFKSQLFSFILFYDFGCNCRKPFFRGLNSPVLLILFHFVSFCFVLFCFVAPHLKKQFSFPGRTKKNV